MYGTRKIDILVNAQQVPRTLVWSLLHYDDDFDLIANITGQATEWIVRPPAGREPESGQVT
jgi:hypothetical protein